MANEEHEECGDVCSNAEILLRISLINPLLSIEKSYL